jgi:hypothetical protein
LVIPLIVNLGRVCPYPRNFQTDPLPEILIRARYPIIYVVSWEEERVERCLREIAEKRDKRLFTWTITQGIVKSGTEAPRAKAGTGKTTDPLAALDAVIDQIDPAIFLFNDFHLFTACERANITIIRRLRDVAYHIRDTYKTIVISAPFMQLAPELAKDVTVVEFGLPRGDITYDIAVSNAREPAFLQHKAGR